MAADLPTRLLELRRSILSMSALVDARMERVIDAIRNGDFSLAEEVRHGDREVDEMEIEIEQNCIQVLVLHQPVAGDLRFILAVLRINGELERIGDHAKGVAKRLLSLQKMGYQHMPEMLRGMGEAVLGMLRETLDALSNNNPELAKRIRREDKDVDDFQRNVLEWAQQEIQSPDMPSKAAISIMSIARGLERVGDICTNIAEDIIFLVEGDVVRHTRT